ncbi:hypothetical protein QUB37_03750 [Microcoleus sp. AT3-A2]|uniref:hypothetical protein n=1 Tax=Microcoleus sp. AT3-A2 TaxID=2818610 RepID=UPI002FD50062
MTQQCVHVNPLNNQRSGPDWTLGPVATPIISVIPAFGKNPLNPPNSLPTDRMESLLPLFIALVFGSGFYHPDDRPPDRGERRHFHQEIEYVETTSSTS